MPETYCTSGTSNISTIEQEGYIKSYIEGPKFAHLPEFLKELAIDNEVNITLDVHKRILRETVFFEVTGDFNKVSTFTRELNAAVMEHKHV